MIQIQTQQVGQPQTHTHGRKKWRSAIYRTPSAEPIMLESRGLVGDQVADTKHHGSPDQAVCCHPIEHYQFWNAEFGLDGDAALQSGAVGENWTLTNINEQSVCINDVFAVGEARVQVSAPRYPCMKQEYKTGVKGFLKRTKETLRTGFYLRVLEPGLVQTGDVLTLESRTQPELTIKRVNAHMLHQYNPETARLLATVPELAEDLDFYNILRPKSASSSI